MLKKIILWTLTILWAATIFCFSHQSAEKSSDLSRSITKKIVNTVSDADSMSQKEKDEIHEAVRKLAHFGLYTGFGILLSALFSAYGISFTRSICFVLAVGILYAASDEIHQKFISERSCQITDVLIDGAGVLTGWALYFLPVYIKRRRHKRNTRGM